jgi:hypothetical protein
MLKVFIILSFLSLNSYAEESRPVAPTGWVELNSDDPILLTWAKAEPEKNLVNVATIMLQRFERSEKFQKFISDNKSDSSGCFELSESGWDQTWCARKKEVYAIVQRGTDPELKEIKQKLKEWVMTHD